VSLVRTDELEQIPKQKLFDRLTRIDEELEIISKQLDKIIKLLEGTTGGAKTQIVPSRVINNRYKVFELDLTKARNNEPLGIEKSLGVVINTVTVTRLDDKAYWRRNDTNGDLEELNPGYEIKDYEIRELYVTNPASGTAGATMKVVVEWRE